MISSILNIVNSGKNPFTASLNTVSTVQTSCHNFKFSGVDCDSNVVVELFAEVVWNATSYETEVEGYRNLDGDWIDFSNRVTPRLSFNCVVDENISQALVLLAQQPLIEMLRVSDAFNWAVQSMNIEQSELGSVISTIVTFEVVNTQSLFVACCGGLYDGAPYEPCDPDGGSPPTPPICDDFLVTIDASSLPTLTANFSGGSGVGTPMFQWLYDEHNDGNFEELVSETAQSIAIVDTGAYRVQVVRDVCVGTSDYLYNTACGSYTLDISFVNGVLVSTPNFPVTAFIWEFETSPSNWSVLGSTGSTHIPLDSGNYRVTVSDAVCGDILSSPINVLLGDDCNAITFTMTRSDQTLNIENITNCIGNATFSWEVDTGSGYTLIAGATMAMLTITENGLYRATVSCDNPTCITKQTLFVLDNCISFQGYIASIIPDVGGVRFTAASVNAPSGASVNYTWYLWQGGQWQQQAAGSVFVLGTPYPSENVWLEVTAGQCVRNDYSHECLPSGGIDNFAAFVATTTVTQWSQNSVTFPQPVDQGGVFTPTQVDGRFVVTKNGVVQHYRPLAGMATTTEQNVYSYDYADGTIITPNAIPLHSGDRMSVTDLQS